MARQRVIHEALGSVYDQVDEIEVDIDDMKIIVFSDHHRGRRDGADDFLPCEPAYLQALSYYFKNGYTLVLLGDVEEFWENPFEVVMKRYENVLNKEQKFFHVNRLFRIWGNHDDAWRFKGSIKKHLHWLFPNLTISEGLKIKIRDKENDVGELFLVHGHQGTFSSDRLAWMSKFFVRYVWRNLQRLFKIPLSTPSKNMGLKSELDMVFYKWANKRKKQVIICGHTHQPVFMSHTHADVLEEQIIEIKKLLEKPEDLSDEKRISCESELEVLDKQIKKVKKEVTSIRLSERRRPCYFNSGCCSFKDGDITGLELVEGRINLVKWERPQSDREGRKVLQRTKLSKCFAELK